MGDVLHSLDARRAVARVNLASLTAPAPPREPDAPEPVAAKLSVRLLDTYGADLDGMKGHAA